MESATAPSSGVKPESEPSSPEGGGDDSLIFTVRPLEWVAFAVVVLATAVLGVTTQEWIGLIGLAATVVGLWIAIRQIMLAQRQIVRTLSVARATQGAMRKTRNQLARNELLTLIAQLQRVDRDLAAVGNPPNVDRVVAALADWRDRGNQFIGVSEGQDFADTELLEALKDTSKDAASLTVELPGPTSTDTGFEIKRIRTKISETCGLLGIVESKLKLHAGEGGTGAAQ